MSKHHRVQAPARHQPVALPTAHGRSRAYAAVCDWLIGGIFAGLPGVVLYAVMTGTNKPLKNLYAFEAAGFSKTTTLLVALLCLAFGLFYYVVIPWVIFPGQTLGKKWFHLRIEKRASGAMHLSDYLVRQALGLLLIEGAATAASTYIRVLITTATRFYVDGYFSIFWNVVTVISIGLVFGTKHHLAIHDYMAKTRVVELPKE